MTIKTLKKHIFENNKIEFVLESIGCHHIKYNANKEFYSCGNYNGDNIGAVNVKNNEYLNVTNWTRSKEFDDCSDIITLTQYNKQCSFIDAIKYLYKLLGLEYNPRKAQKKKEESKFDPLAIFKRVKTMKKKVDVAEIQTINEDVLDEYVPILHIDWLREGITPLTAKKFGLAYSYRRKRVIIPMRHWLTGELLGINARTTVENYEELGIKKYFITPTYQKSLNLFGLYENYDDIQESGYVVVYESEKSVLKRHSLRHIDPSKDAFDYSNGVALSGHTLSDEQARILIGLNVEIVIALDNDVLIEEVWSICEKFYRIRNVSYIVDEDNLLGKKDSPADARNNDFRTLLANRVKYDEQKHKKYLKSLEKK